MPRLWIMLANTKLDLSKIKYLGMAVHNVFLKVGDILF